MLGSATEAGKMRWQEKKQNKPNDKQNWDQPEDKQHTVDGNQNVKANRVEDKQDLSEARQTG